MDEWCFSWIGSDGKWMVRTPRALDRSWCCGVGTPSKIDRLSTFGVGTNLVDRPETLWGKGVACGSEAEGQCDESKEELHLGTFLFV